MSFKLVKEPDKLPDFSGKCPVCYNRLYHLHDLQCSVCNNTSIMWCPQCEEHYELDLEGEKS